MIAVEKNIKWPEGGQPVARRPLKTWKYLNILQMFLKLKYLTWEAQGKNPECSKGIFSSGLEINLIFSVRSQLGKQY